MKWKKPPIIKIYEALGAIADDRVEVSGLAAKVFSSSRNKFYEAEYDPTSQSVMANDNASYWKGTLGYPVIALLLKLNILKLEKEKIKLLKGIAWKDLNQKHKNDFEKTLASIKESMDESKWVELSEYADGILKKIIQLDFNYLGNKKLPPKGY